MNATTRKTIAAILTERDATERHAATVRKQLDEDRAARRKAYQRRLVRSTTLSGLIRR